MTGDQGVRVAVPPGWIAVPFAPADLAAYPQVETLSWQAWAPRDGRTSDAPAARLVAGCFAGHVGGWTPEAEPILLDRLGAVVSSTALRLVGVGGRRVVASERGPLFTSERLEGSGDAEGKLVAKSILGFLDAHGGSGRLLGCVVLCVDDVGACSGTVDAAAVDAQFVARPTPTLAVRALVGMAQHPAAVASCAVAASLLAAVVAVTTRRRPRTK